MQQKTGALVPIPLDKLTPELLSSVIEQFVLREGTDYGSQEISLEAKVAQVHRQLERRQAFVVFDAESESVTILKAEECPRENPPET